MTQNCGRSSPHRICFAGLKDRSSKARENERPRCTQKPPLSAATDDAEACCSQSSMAPHAAASTTTMRGTMKSTFSSSCCRERGRYHHQHNRGASKVVSRAQSDGGSSSSSPSLLAAVGRAVVPSLAAVALAVAPPASAAQLTTVRIAGSSNPNVFEAQKTLVQAWSIVRDTFVDRSAVGARWDGELADALQRTSAPSVDANGAYSEIGAMLKTLHDPYTRFVPADEFRNFRLKSEGEVDGVGLLIASEPRSGRVFVLSPIDGSPAARAGIMAGDEVVGIDGRPTRGLAGEEAAVRLRGRHGTAVTVKIARREPGLGALPLPLPPASPAPLQGQGLGSRWGGLLRARRAAFRPAEYRGSRPNVRLRQVRLVRDSIVLNPVKAELIQASLPTPPHPQPQPQHQGEGEGGVGGQGAGASARVPLSVASVAPASGSVGSNSVTSDSKIGYLKLEAFNEKSAGALVDAAQEMKRAGATRFILDLRDNPGGLLNTSLDIASLWLQVSARMLRSFLLRFFTQTPPPPPPPNTHSSCD